MSVIPTGNSVFMGLSCKGSTVFFLVILQRLLWDILCTFQTSHFSVIWWTSVYPPGSTSEKQLLLLWLQGRQYCTDTSHFQEKWISAPTWKFDNNFTHSHIQYFPKCVLILGKLPFYPYSSSLNGFSLQMRGCWTILNQFLCFNKIITLNFDCKDSDRIRTFKTRHEKKTYALKDKI